MKFKRAATQEHIESMLKKSEAVVRAGSKTPSEEASRRGKRSRNKGSTYERTIAKKLQEKYGEEFVRTPMSGGFAKNKTSAENFRGDIVPADSTKIKLKLHLELKNHKNLSVKQWIEQAESDAPKGTIPTVIFHKDGTSKNYVVMEFEDFCKIVPKENVMEVMK